MRWMASCLTKGNRIDSVDITANYMEVRSVYFGTGRWRNAALADSADHVRTVVQGRRAARLL